MSNRNKWLPYVAGVALVLVVAFAFNAKSLTMISNEIYSWVVNDLSATGDVTVTGDISGATVSASDVDANVVIVGDGTTADQTPLRMTYKRNDYISMKFYDDILGLSALAPSYQARSFMFDPGTFSGSSVNFGFGVQADKAATIYSLSHTVGQTAAIYLGYLPDSSSYVGFRGASIETNGDDLFYKYHTSLLTPQTYMTLDLDGDTMIGLKVAVPLIVESNINVGDTAANTVTTPNARLKMIYGGDVFAGTPGKRQGIHVETTGDGSYASDGVWAGSKMIGNNEARGLIGRCYADASATGNCFGSQLLADQTHAGGDNNGLSVFVASPGGTGKETAAFFRGGPAFFGGDIILSGATNDDAAAGVHGSDYGDTIGYIRQVFPDGDMQLDALRNIITSDDFISTGNITGDLLSGTSLNVTSGAIRTTGSSRVTIRNTADTDYNGLRTEDIDIRSGFDASGEDPITFTTDGGTQIGRLNITYGAANDWATLSFNNTYLYMPLNDDGSHWYTGFGETNNDWRWGTNGTEFAITPSGSLSLAGGIATNRTAVTTPTYTVLSTDSIIGVNDANTVTLSFPAAIQADGKIWTVKDESGAGAANNIVIRIDGTQTIDGATNQTISTNYGAVDIYSDGTNMFIK